jgi:hypothetical protein
MKTSRKSIKVAINFNSCSFIKNIEGKRFEIMNIKILMPRFRVAMPVFLIGIGFILAVFKEQFTFLPIENLDVIGIGFLLIGAILYIKRIK